MVKVKKIICLADSRKYSGHCVAGKEYSDTGAGQWVRVVSNREYEELSELDIMLLDGKPPSVLDIISVSVLKEAPHEYQSENHLINESYRWRREGTFALSRLDALLDTPETLWINGCSGSLGRNDRVRIVQAKQSVSNSLLFIKPSHAIVHIMDALAGKRQIRVEFQYRGESYNLAVTDLAFEHKCEQREKGSYPVKKEVYFTVSLGETFGDFCYKLIAAVIFRP